MVFMQICISTPAYVYTFFSFSYAFKETLSRKNQQLPVRHKKYYIHLSRPVFPPSIRMLQPIYQCLQQQTFQGILEACVY